MVSNGVAHPTSDRRSPYWSVQSRELPAMNIFPHIGPIAALLAGVLILVMPKLLNYIVAIYLIIIGAVGLFGK
jgi:hypothetical protein